MKLLDYPLVRFLDVLGCPERLQVGVCEGGRAESSGGQGHDQTGRAGAGTRLEAAPMGKDFEPAPQLQCSRKSPRLQRLILMKIQVLLHGFGLEPV